MVQSHIMNILPRRLLASLWASQETRISLSHLMPVASHASKNKLKHHDHQHYPAAVSSSFLCSELPIRYTHILRLLSTLHDDALQTPLIRNVTQRYLIDICSLLHPSLRQTSPRSFSHKIHKLRQRQAQSLIWLRYALASSSTATSHSVMLMDHINSISLSIYCFLDQHVSCSNSTGNQVQTLCPVEIAHQAVADARKTCGDTFGDSSIVPPVSIQKQHSPSQQDLTFTHIPNILHRVLYESTLLALSAHYTQVSTSSMISTTSISSSWLKRHYRRLFRSTQHDGGSPLQLDVFGGPTSIGYRLNSTATLSHRDLHHDIPRDLLGVPLCPSILRRATHHPSPASVSMPSQQQQQDEYQDQEQAEWNMWSGWRAAKTMASHFGGNLDVVSADGLGSTMYLALDRDCHFLERYPSALFHRHSSSSHRRLSLQRASSELDAFLYATADPNDNSNNHAIHYTPATHHHAVSLTAAVGHA
ncbi:hypothetical protein BCR42DRAFT_67898 [Absidia repens]|uniref:Protein-serine/threonine kinase n=1 Tax=Absidia repens TaxID=90262 RepID=A0A1X2IC22_9FUNG|nr:hypothetical protein BCR42DRAFT_67898 [Absidia repens]